MCNYMAKVVFILYLFVSSFALASIRIYRVRLFTKKKKKNQLKKFIGIRRSKLQTASLIFVYDFCLLPVNLY